MVGRLTCSNINYHNNTKYGIGIGVYFRFDNFLKMYK